MNRWDETWHRLREWTNGQGPSERLAALLLDAEGYAGIDPSHPLGGRDAKKDAVAFKHGDRWTMAAYFPRGQQPFHPIRDKFVSDQTGVSANSAVGMAFVTNQELSLAERKQLEDAVDTPVDIFHLERVTTILDRPGMASVRHQFLGIDAPGAASSPTPRSFREVLDAMPVTRGAPDHWMLYDGMLLFRVGVTLVAPDPRHPAAANPRSMLKEASEEAAVVSAAWPANTSLLARRLDEGWESISAHIWGAGRIFDRVELLVEKPSAAVACDTRSSALVMDRTWATRIQDDAGGFAFHAAREAEIAAELLVALKLAGGLMADLGGLDGIDIAIQIAAAPSGRTLVSSERAVSGGRFGSPAGHLPKPVQADVDSHYSDTARVPLDDVLDPFRAAERLLGPWLATFRSDDLLRRLRPPG